MTADKVGHYDWFNRDLFKAIPASAKRILDVGCNTGLLGEALKKQDASRYVAGIELDPEAGSVAESRLDAVHISNVETDDLGALETDFDVIVLGDVIEHLVDPLAALIKLRALLADDGELFTSIPNIQHYSIFRRLLKGDFQYRDTGLLDATHLRFFCLANIDKLMLDADMLPRLHRRMLKQDPDLQPHLEHLATRMGVNRMNLDNMQTFQYQTTARRAPALPDLAPVPVTFVVHSRYTGILKDNFYVSPMLKGDHPHQVIISRQRQMPLADALQAAIAQARHDVVALVQEHMYLPRHWAHRLAADIPAMEALAGADWVAGAAGLRQDPTISHAGAIVTPGGRQYCATGEPVDVEVLDDNVIVMPTDNALNLDPELGDHLYGIDVGLRARRQGRAVFALRNPCLNNSQFLNRVAPGFEQSRAALLEKWPDAGRFLQQ